MTWAKPEFSRNQIDKAGKSLVENATNSENFKLGAQDPLLVLNNWRSSHGYPLHVITTTLRRRALKISQGAIVAQRLKRLESIKLKLERKKRENQQSMKLSRMQDIGGCRAILEDMDQVTELVKIYQENLKRNSMHAKLVRLRSYINEPKKDGYRCFHLVLKYQSRGENYRMYNGLEIEIQVRSKLQHAWATAVEIVDTFTGNNLKIGLGAKDWKRFFSLMGTVIAIKEETPGIPNTPHEWKNLRDETIFLCEKLKVIESMESWRKLIDYRNQLKNKHSVSPDTIRNFRHVVLSLDTENRMSYVVFFGNPTEANDYYLKQERETQDNPFVQVVLVGIDSLEKLRDAYPNYNLDSNKFLEVVREFIHGTH